MNRKGSPDKDLPVAERIAYLVAGFLRGSLTEAEHDELDDWIIASDENMKIFEDLTDPVTIEKGLRWQQQIDQEVALFNIKNRIAYRKKNLHIKPEWLIGLAACLMILVLGLYFFYAYSLGRAVHTAQNAIQPGKDQAVLLLAGGRSIILDSAGSGTMASEGKVRIEKSSGGEIRYSGSDTVSGFHTLSIPRGGQYRLVLDDGTRVWLNSESSLRFPASFGTRGRQVELRGEAYFEVAKNAASPFRVLVIASDGESQAVEVLGTHFNINAYGENDLRTTLLEGAVRVSQAGTTVNLRPGQEAIGNKSGLKVQAADTESATAWKNGLFRFRNEDIQTIAAQLSRWYNIDVEIRGTINDHFTATIDRSEPLQNTLQILENTHRLHFKLENKKLFITP